MKKDGIRWLERFILWRKKTKAIGATSDYGTRFNILKGRVIQKNHDPWLPLCEECTLPDCPRGEGAMQTGRTGQQWPGCAIWEAKQEGKKF